ncbi:MAG: hypothetical protein GOMPHAMPRED_004877 [Gomphillus americanus]|uniref:Uncharacterized protein n=1 Tax=Gomphillus americanus TaxID=1940652 RepID=A0A8H3EMB8_9LECA|nr:MAG: hypothetical protein GOMPHAMPRED_004877 [Gomphillus americanus]
MPRIIEKIVGPLVGLTSEAIAHQQKKSQSSSYGVHSHNANTGDDYGVTENPDYESDAEQWELDSAAEEIHATHNQNQNVPQGNWMSPATIDTIVSNFVQKHPPGDPSSGSYLQLPVVIPQKRPHQKARGFVRAYSPVLEDCGIDQATWMEFLDSFHESIKVSPVFNVINVSVQTLGMVANFVPSVALQATTAVVTAANIIAKETYTRSRTNTFIADMNERYFKPQGLYCLMITYKPESGSVVETMDIHVTAAKALNASEHGGSGANPTGSAPTAPQAENAALNEKLKHTMKLWTGRSSAVTTREAQMSAVAPLIFPDLDKANETQKQNWFNRGMAFTADYFDKRAVAQWRAENPDTTLADITPAPEFLTAQGDPTTLRPNLSALTSITGRESRIAARVRLRRDARQDRNATKWEDRSKAGSGIRGLMAKATKGKPPIVAVKRLIKMDVIYLLLVKLPTPEEMQAVASQAKESR